MLSMPLRRRASWLSVSGGARDYRMCVAERSSPLRNVFFVLRFSPLGFEPDKEEYFSRTGICF
jgi:hypothetical protein